MKPLLPILLLLALALGCSDTPPPSSPPPTSPPTVPDFKHQYLVYISDRGSGFDIFRNGEDGRSERKMTDAPGWEWEPQPVRDLEMIIYNAQDTNGNFARRSIGVDGQPTSENAPTIPEAKLDPTGKHLVWPRTVGDSVVLVVGSFENVGDSTEITAFAQYNGRPEWSSDGDQLVYVSDQTGSNELFIYTLSTQKTQRITVNEKREKYTSWSPDGQTIAATMTDGDLPNDIFLIDVHTLEVRVLTRTLENESEIAWSPDGKYIAFHAQKGEGDHIYLVEVETGTITQVTKGTGYHGEPDWIQTAAPLN